MEVSLSLLSTLQLVEITLTLPPAFISILLYNKSCPVPAGKQVIAMSSMTHLSIEDRMIILAGITNGS